MKKSNWLVCLVTAVAVFIPVVVFASQESSSLQLRLIRNFGYGGLGKIQGNFTLKIDNPPEELEKVEFFMDEEMIATVDSEPFQFKFHTSTYADGEHKMTAMGTLLNDTRVESNRITKSFLSSDQAFGETQQLLGPILIGVAILTLLGVGVPLVLNRNKEFVLGKYGRAGGAVCPRCELPLSRSVLSPNLLVGKLVICPHCKKTSILARASNTKLKDAEIRYANKDKQDIVQSGKHDLRKQLEDSRFEE